MKIWTNELFDSLIPAERRAVETRVPQAEGGEKQESAVDYLNRIGAGTSAVESYVESDRAANRAAMAEAADALFDAGLAAGQIVPLATGFAAASAEVRAQVVALLTRV